MEPELDMAGNQKMDSVFKEPKTQGKGKTQMATI
jgi:hypothetical protein